MLEEIYIRSLIEMLSAEKKYGRYFKKLSAAALTDELRAGLSPAHSDQMTHVQRLGLCLKLQKTKAAGSITALDQHLLECGKSIVKGKTRSLQKDLKILQISQQILQQKIQVYSYLQQIAVALGIEQAALLLEQCFKDESNAYGYLLQIAQNIIFPQALQANES